MDDVGGDDGDEHCTHATGVRLLPCSFAVAHLEWRCASHCGCDNLWHMLRLWKMWCLVLQARLVAWMNLTFCSPIGCLSSPRDDRAVVPKPNTDYWGGQKKF